MKKYFYYPYHEWKIMPGFSQKYKETVYNFDVLIETMKSLNCEQF